MNDAWENVVFFPHKGFHVALVSVCIHTLLEKMPNIQVYYDLLPVALEH